MKVVALGNGFMFHFKDEVNSKGEFVRTNTQSGIILKSTVDNSAKQPRWVKVSGVGPDCTFIKDGDMALLPSLRWTSGLKFNDTTIWKSDEKEVAAVMRDGKIIPAPTFVLFSITPHEPIQQKSGLFVVFGNPLDTPSGTVTHIGEKVSKELNNATIYYNDVNFNDYIEDTNLAFIKEDDILVYIPQ